MSSSPNRRGYLNIGAVEDETKSINRFMKCILEKFTLAIPYSKLRAHRISTSDARIITDLPSRITITFHHLSKVIQVPGENIDLNSKRKTVERLLLDDVSGQIHPGEIVALMSPSGSGKTTLLNTLAGRTPAGVTGNIWFNNQPYDENFKHQLAYVLQEDLFFESLTVKQQLTYTALLRLPETLTRQDKITHVNDIIEQFHLQTCANTPIQLISGGERKRMNIATELLTNPSVIFLDEPTSGLDSTSTAILMNILQKLAAEGKTILTSIHQPSSHIFQSFNRIILIADGKTVYIGKPSHVVDYFATLGHHLPAQYNPADFIMDLIILNLEVREELKEFYIQNRDNDATGGRKYLTAEPSGKEEDLPSDYSLQTIGRKYQKKWPIGFIAQTSILWQRNWILTSKVEFRMSSCIQALCLSIFFGLFWLRMDYNEKTLTDRSSFVYFLLQFWPFEVYLIGVLSFPSERRVIEKERASGSFRLSSYFFAKFFSETPLKLIIPSISIAADYWMANMNPNVRIFFGILAFNLMLILVSESIGRFLGAALHDVRRAYVTGNIIFFCSVLTGGFFVRHLPSWLIWSKWLSPYRYAYCGCLQLQFSDDRLYQCTNGEYINACRKNFNGTFTGREALKYFEVDLNIGLNFLVLFGMFLAFQVSTYIALRYIKISHGRA